jgi:hypothetical protein
VEGGFEWEDLLDKKFISPEDLNLYYMAPNPEAAADHIIRFYRNYHSSRYVRDDLVIRLKQKLRDDDIQRLETEFSVLIKQGRMIQRGPLEGESDHLSLPRLVFHHTRYKFGMIRKLIDRINECEPVG